MKQDVRLNNPRAYSKIEHQSLPSSECSNSSEPQPMPPKRIGQADLQMWRQEGITGLQQNRLMQKILHSFRRWKSRPNKALTSKGKVTANGFRRDSGKFCLEPPRALLKAFSLFLRSIIDCSTENEAWMMIEIPDYMRPCPM